MPDRLPEIEQRVARNYQGYTNGIHDSQWLREDADHLLRRVKAAEAVIAAFAEEVRFDAGWSHRRSQNAVAAWSPITEEP